MGAVVYRLYDADYRLLYVGQSVNLAQRLATHGREKQWWSDVDTISVEHFPSKDAAARAERRALCSEAPRYNVQNVPGGRERRKPRGTAVAA